MSRVAERGVIFMSLVFTCFRAFWTYLGFFLVGKINYFHGWGVRKISRKYSISFFNPFLSRLLKGWYVCQSVSLSICLSVCWIATSFWDSLEFAIQRKTSRALQGAFHEANSRAHQGVPWRLLHETTDLLKNCPNAFLIGQMCLLSRLDRKKLVLKRHSFDTVFKWSIVLK